MGDCWSKCCPDEEDDSLSAESGRVSPSPNPSSRINTIGSQVYIYKQDPSQSQVGIRVLWLPIDIRPGPVTDDVLIMGMPRIYRPTDNFGNFLYRLQSDPDGFDAVNTLSVVQHVLWMYRRVLSKAKKQTLNWLWGSRPIQVYPHAGRDRNAHYSRDEKALKFFYFTNGGRMIYSSRSWDVVAHEAGHAVLDSLQPRWLTSRNAYTGALHEAFGDITAIFSILDQLDMCELVVAHTKGNIHKRSNFLAAMGEEFGSGVGKYYGIRNAAEDLRVSQVSEEVHELSTVFTGAVYDVLVKIFIATLHLAEYQPAETLYRAGRHLLSVFLLAVLEAPQKNATFEDLALLMIKKEPQNVFKGFIREEFTRREVFNEWARPRPYRTRMQANQSPYACDTYSICTRKKSSSQNTDSHSRGNGGQSHTTHHDFPSDNRSSISQRTVQQHQDMRNSNAGSTSRRSWQQQPVYQHLDNNVQGSLSHGSLQQGQAHQHVNNSTKGSLGHSGVQPNQGHHHVQGSTTGNFSQRRLQASQPYQDMISSNKGSLSHRHVEHQHLTYQGTSTQGCQNTQPQRFAGTNGHTYYSRTTVDDRVWENQSAAYSDSVFDSTEI